MYICICVTFIMIHSWSYSLL